MPDWLLTLLFLRVERLRNRVLALMEKLRAGTYRAPRPRTPRPETAPKRERRHFPAHLAQIMPADARLPTKFAWLHHLLHDNARRYTGPAAGGLLRDLLQADPEIVEFAKTCPALARQLRALCHMLGLKPPHMPEYIKPPRARPSPSAKSRKNPSPINTGCAPAPYSASACAVSPKNRADSDLILARPYCYDRITFRMQSPQRTKVFCFFFSKKKRFLP